MHVPLAPCLFCFRGEGRDKDTSIVFSLGEKYETKVFVTRFDTVGFAAAQRLSIQEAARKLRYDWFEEVRKEHGFACTLLAHHANDNIETVLMKFFRGTGLEGLTGMPE